MYILFVVLESFFFFFQFLSISIKPSFFLC